MAANTEPIFTKEANVGFATLTAANTNTDGLTGTYATIFTAGLEGGYLEKIFCKALGSCTGTVARFFLVNPGDSAAALIADVTMATTTASATAALVGYEVVLDIAIPAGYKIKVALGTAVSAGWAFTAIGGNY